MKETSGYDIDDKICDDMLTNEKLEEYAIIEENGTFCGDTKAVDLVSARCMDIVCEENLKRKNSAKILSPLFENKYDETENEGGVYDFLKKYDK